MRSRPARRRHVERVGIPGIGARRTLDPASHGGWFLGMRSRRRLWSSRGRRLWCRRRARAGPLRGSPRRGRTLCAARACGVVTDSVGAVGVGAVVGRRGHTVLAVVASNDRDLPRGSGAPTPVPVVRFALCRLSEVPESLEIEPFGIVIRRFAMTIPMPFVGHRASPPSSELLVDSTDPLIVANPATPEE